MIFRKSDIGFVILIAGLVCACANQPEAIRSVMNWAAEDVLQGMMLIICALLIPTSSLVAACRSWPQVREWQWMSPRIESNLMLAIYMLILALIVMSIILFVITMNQDMSGTMYIPNDTFMFTSPF